MSQDQIMDKPNLYGATRIATPEETSDALERAKGFQMDSTFPSFYKSLKHSQKKEIKIPKPFDREYMPRQTATFKLEDGKGSKHHVNYHHSDATDCSSAFHGGWSNFYKSHRLADGDALVFELIEPKRFEVHIFKAVVEEEPVRVMEEEMQALKAKLEKMQALIAKLEKMPAVVNENSELKAEISILKAQLEKMLAVENENSELKAEISILKAQINRERDEKGEMLADLVDLQLRVMGFTSKYVQ